MCTIFKAESELEDLKHELENVLGKENLQRRLSVARSTKTTLSDFQSDVESIAGKCPTIVRRSLGEANLK